LVDLCDRRKRQGFTPRFNRHPSSQIWQLLLTHGDGQGIAKNKGFG
jgi:hypothetical protein